MLFLNQEHEKSKQVSELEDKQATKVQYFVKKQINELELKQIKEQRKLDVIQKKHQQSIKFNTLVAYLENNKSKQKDAIQMQVFKGIEKNGLS